MLRMPRFTLGDIVGGRTWQQKNGPTYNPEHANRWSELGPAGIIEH